MDDKNCEVNHEEFEEKNEEIFREDPKNDEEDVNLNVEEKNDGVNIRITFIILSFFKACRRKK